MSLRRRILLTTIFLLFVVLLPTIIILSWILRQSLFTQTTFNSVQISETIALSIGFIDQSADEKTPVRLSRLVNNLLANGTVQAIWVVDPNLEIVTFGVAEDFPLEPQLSEMEMTQLQKAMRQQQIIPSQTDRSLKIYSPIFQENEPSGAILVYLPLETAQSFSNDQQQLTVIVAGLALAVGLLAFVALSHWTIKPLRELNTAAKLIAAGKLDETLPVGYVDELDRLTQSFNRMVQQIQERNDQLEAYNRRLEKEVKRRTAQLEEQVDRLSTLNLITQTVGSVRNMQLVLKMVAQTMARLFDAANSGIALLNEARTELKVVAEYSRDATLASHIGVIIPLENNPSSVQVIETGHSLVVPNAQTNPLTAPIHHLLRARNTHCLLIIPLLSRGEIIGTIGVNSDKPDREFSEAEVILSEMIAAQIAGAIDNAHLFETERAAREHAETLQAATQALSRSLDLQQVFTLILTELRKVVPYDSASVQQLKGQRLEIIGGIGLPNLEAIIGDSFDITSPQYPNQQVVQQRQPIILADAIVDYKNFHVGRDTQPESSSWLGVPLLFGDRLIGMVTLDKYEPNFYRPAQAKLAMAFASQAAIAIENARLYTEAQETRARLEAEINIVQQLQQMVLPTPQELQQVDGLEIAGFMEPADEVGGDYYDVLQHNGRVKIGIGDVTGHGLESGVLMLMTQVAVRALLTSGETNAVRFLDIVNRTIYDNVKRMKASKMLSLALLDYTPPAHIPSTVNNGHHDPSNKLRSSDQYGQLQLSGQHEEVIVIRQNGNIELIDTLDLGFPVGLENEIADFVNETTIQLQPGDGIVLYTDGIIEAENQNQVQYGLERLCRLISRHWAKSVEEIKETIIQDVRRHINHHIIYDDLTLVVLKQK